MSMFVLFSESSNICFLDASGGMDGSKVRLFLLVAYSNAGGIPLGEPFPQFCAYCIALSVLLFVYHPMHRDHKFKIEAR